MESSLLPAAPPNELRIETSTSILTPIDTADADPELPAVEAAQLSPKVDRIRHHLIPARTATCVRAPCLKRQASVPISSITTNLAASRLKPAPIQDRVASNPLPTSFAPPRSLVLRDSSRHVHFDDLPPEEFYVLSGESYDRRPIKCTQGGSEFDMSLPPRCSSYNGDDANGDDANDEDASSTDDRYVAMESAEEPAPDVGFFRDPSLENWACIKNGTDTAAIGYQPRQQQSGLMASGRSLHFSALSSLQQASALGLDSPRSQSPVSSQKVSLPVHGFRSFGGLQNSLAPEVTFVLAPLSSQGTVSSAETTPLALRNFSPDATPMPSPSLHKSIGALSSVNYFAVGSDSAAEQRKTNASSIDATLASENAHNAMEVLRDASPPAEPASKATRDFRRTQPVLTTNGLGSPTWAKPAPILVNAADASAQSTPRRLGLERRTAEKDASRISSLHPTTAALNGTGIGSGSSNGASASSPGWSGLVGITSSPLSSRCSSVDPWSSLSSDGDCDDTESPGNETSWISSNCTSPDLGPFEQMVEGFHHQKNGSATSSGPGSQPLAQQQPNGASKLGKVSVNEVDDSDHELNTPKNTDCADEANFSSSVETAHTVNWEQKHMPLQTTAGLFGGLSIGEISMSEAITPDSSRRPSFHHQEMPSHRMSPRMRSSFGERENVVADHLDEDDSNKLRVRSLSRDGHAKKKSSKCRFCRSLRQRIKASSTDSSAPTSSGGSAQMTDAESEMDCELKASSATTRSEAQNGFGHHRDPTSSAEVSEMEDEDASRSFSSISQLRASVQSLSMDEWSSGTSRSRSRDGMVLSHLAIAKDALHERESSNSPGESCSESPHLGSVNLPTMCTCNKKKEKERMKKKMHKERELERERDREWERDQARGRQKKLFGESFGDADISCLSALDGF